MKKSIEIHNNHQKIRDIEGLVEDVSIRFLLQETYYGNIMALSDFVFLNLCKLEGEYPIRIEFESDHDAYKFIWTLDKVLYDNLLSIRLDPDIQFDNLIEKLSDKVFYNDSEQSVQFYFATRSFNHSLSMNRMNQLRAYYKTTSTIIQKHDTFFDN
ncbi:MAG: hypothetical protein CVT92_01860 [Bacteroidetes bacterium HGW-Bacteroidetes-1]|jgi:hypothetical protein|nr:MAG: hypothetical protein CVT92_01860 [Bacteroidetes bacterium HGW-Bacteroidetes-1]